jgi:hypothetical protein
VLVQDDRADAAEVVARIERVPAPCDVEWRIRRHTARALAALRTGDLEPGLAEARAAVGTADRTSVVLCQADAQRAHAELLRASGRRAEAATAVRRALELDDAKGNAVAGATMRRRFAELLR